MTNHAINRFKERSALLLVVLSAAALFALPAIVAASPPGQPISPAEQEVVDLVNQERTSRGIPPLTVNYSLMEAAWSHNEHMFDTGCFSHTACGDGNPGDRIRPTGYKFTTWGENIAKGQTSPASVMDAWMHSPGHRANILSTKYKDIGVAHHDASWPNGPLWTQVFASPQDGYATVTPPAGSGSKPGNPDVPTPTTCVVPMDYNGDLTVDMQDVQIISSSFMATPGDPRWEEAYDVIPNGIVDIYDVFQVILADGNGC
jgi:uncharacterized protein YkwD